ncbi:AcrR family transcriptional regulator [Alkalibacillus filiformis]|uniref:AcrR family transcriptional regulator n=1 Tax=Alkalibacillus filiformis TaxID=200990 RepID=A0ABU0DUZ0_9BACI|nr:TetR/AcrR family transcriptional regulator [Alkalibacillus filiformis]MDQ0352246.1 AcrR family transcriptional regulator [Alkalibacillus filiformis]
MSYTFENLEEEKQQRIINAALEEFSLQGYEKASTNRIVNQARIGKGMLFYYFNNKQELYYYLVNYCFDLLHNKYLPQINLNETDLIERYRKATVSKFSFYKEHPNVFNFLGTLMLADGDLLTEEVQEKIDHLRHVGYDLVYNNLDYSRFREDVDSEKAMELIKWAMEGYQQQVLANFKGEKMMDIDLDQLSNEFSDYLDVLKTAFYK